MTQGGVAMKRLMSIAVCVALLAPLMGCDELL